MGKQWGVGVQNADGCPVCYAGRMGKQWGVGVQNADGCPVYYAGRMGKQWGVGVQNADGCPVHYAGRMGKQWGGGVQNVQVHKVHKSQIMKTHYAVQMTKMSGIIFDKHLTDSIKDSIIKPNGWFLIIGGRP